MDPLTLSLIAMGVGTGIKAISGLFDDTAHKQADLTRQAANLKVSAIEENQRRAEGQQTQVLSSTRARMAASGFSVDSKSYENYLTGMALEFQKQNDWARQSGMAAVDLMRKSADVQDKTGAKKGFQYATDILGGVAQMAAFG